MTTLTQRAYQRLATQAPFQYAPLNSEQFHPTRACDFSTGGVCFETHEPLEPGTDICMVMEAYNPEFAGLEAFRSYVASIRWTHLLSKNGSERYLAGGRFVTRSHEVITTENQLPRQLCDLCGAMLPLNRLETTSSGAQLCRQCMKHYNKLPAGKIRQSIERYLIGNVV
ncbi:MAG: hypothetical protein P8010_03760 [Desulfosarcinaceae bacterium]|jgi:hypothetical protein